MNKIRVRYGPSPTGIPHIGNIRTAIFNYLFVKNKQGNFILRIEDTDQKRLIAESVQKIKESLLSLNLKWDEEYFQSQRLKLYEKYLNILKKKNSVYEEDGAWRFKISGYGKITWNDYLHGKVEFPKDVIEEFVIMKSDGFPTYHFASVIDDHEMQISHVIRGDEWISSTPKHLLLYQAFDWQPPIFVHLPPILGANRKKLSKREGAKSVTEYLNEGYLPQALTNFLALLGWSPKGDRELFGLDELVQEFSLDRLNKNSPIFNHQKLDWFNKQWIKQLPEEELSELINELLPAYPKQKIKEVLPLVKDRMTTIKDFATIAKLFFEKPQLNLFPQIPASGPTLSRMANSFESLPEKDWVPEILRSKTESLAPKENVDKKDLFKSIGIAVSGSTVTPPLFESLEKLGKEETVSRLQEAAKKKK